MGTIVVGGQKINMTLAVGPSSGSVPVQEVTFSGSTTIIYDLQSGTNLQFVTRAGEPAARYIDELATDVWLLGDVLQARFRAWAVWQEWFINGQDNVNVMAVTYKKLLSRRNVVGAAGLAFNNIDLGDIIWGMWQHTQSQTGGSLGITAGAKTSGIVRTRTYKEGEQPSASKPRTQWLQEGIWWDIDQNLVFTAGAPRQRTDALHTAAPRRQRPTAPAGVGLRLRQRRLRGRRQRQDSGRVGRRSHHRQRPARPMGTGLRMADRRPATDPSTIAPSPSSTHRAFPSPTGTSTWNRDDGSATLQIMLRGMFAVLSASRPHLAAPIGQPAEKIVVFVTQLSVNFDEDGAMEIKAVVMERPDLPVPS